MVVVGMNVQAQGLGERSDSGPGAKSVECPAERQGVNAARVRGGAVETTTRHCGSNHASLSSFGSDVGERADRSTAHNGEERPERDAGGTVRMWDLPEVFLGIMRPRCWLSVTKR